MANKTITERLFTAESRTDSKHILNTCQREVPQTLLDRVEQGCTLETLEELTRKFDVFKYQTQITIHGLFPALSTRRVGCYVNLTQNKNKSIGVRYTAIDHEKKERLYNRLAMVSGWRVHEDSSSFYAYHGEKLPKDGQQAMDVYKRYKAEAERVDTSLFVGRVDCYLAQEPWGGGVWVYVELHVRCFYEKDFSALFENVSGMTMADGDVKVAAYLEEKRRKDEERRRELEDWQAKAEEARKTRDAENEQKRLAFLQDHPLCGFEHHDRYVPKAGDVVVRLSKPSEFYGGYVPRWNYHVVQKSFGRLTLKPTDENGKAGYQRGSAIDRYLEDVWVKAALFGRSDGTINER